MWRSVVRAGGGVGVFEGRNLSQGPQVRPGGVSVGGVNGEGDRC